MVPGKKRRGYGAKRSSVYGAPAAQAALDHWYATGHVSRVSGGFYPPPYAVCDCGWSVTFPGRTLDDADIRAMLPGAA